jgi:hypothetical protein
MNTGSSPSELVSIVPSRGMTSTQHSRGQKMKSKTSRGLKALQCPFALVPAKLFPSLPPFYRRKRALALGKKLASSFSLKEIVHQMTFLIVYFDQAETL